jgi:hypothetical protein
MVESAVEPAARNEVAAVDVEPAGSTRRGGVLDASTVRHGRGCLLRLDALRVSPQEEHAEGEASDEHREVAAVLVVEEVARAFAVDERERDVLRESADLLRPDGFAVLSERALDSAMIQDQLLPAAGGAAVGDHFGGIAFGPDYGVVVWTSYRAPSRYASTHNGASIGLEYTRLVPLV